MKKIYLLSLSAIVLAVLVIIFAITRYSSSQNETEPVVAYTPPPLETSIGSKNNNIYGQVVYTGTLGNDPIEIVMTGYGDKTAKAVYIRKNQGYRPVELTGQIQATDLVLHEEDSGRGINIDTFTFKNFDYNAEYISGEWKSEYLSPETSGGPKRILLTRLYDIQPDNTSAWDNKELLQVASLPSVYFKTVLRKNKGDFYPRIKGVNIYDQTSNKLIQSIHMDGENLQNIDSVAIGDYNFDGIGDFSVFENSAAGPNTTRKYFIFDTVTQKYIDSGIAGVSLTFDSSKKTITETNQCCAGSQIYKATYTFEKNVMNLVHESCFVYDDKKKSLVEVPVEKCK